MIHPQAWENERRIVEITQPVPVTEWAHKTDWEHERLETLPYDSRIAGGRYDGGHVIVLHTENNTFMYAIPPEVIVLLKGILPDDRYSQLIQRTPSLAEIAASELR